MERAFHTRGIGKLRNIFFVFLQIFIVDMFLLNYSCSPRAKQDWHCRARLSAIFRDGRFRWGFSAIFERTLLSLTVQQQHMYSEQMVRLVSAGTSSVGQIAPAWQFLPTHFAIGQGSVHETPVAWIVHSGSSQANGHSVQGYWCIPQIWQI